MAGGLTLPEDGEPAVVELDQDSAPSTRAKAFARVRQTSRRLHQSTNLPSSTQTSSQGSQLIARGYLLDSPTIRPSRQSKPSPASDSESELNIPGPSSKRPRRPTGEREEFNYSQLQQDRNRRLRNRASSSTLTIPNAAPIDVSQLQQDRNRRSRNRASSSTLTIPNAAPIDVDATEVTRPLSRSNLTHSADGTPRRSTRLQQRQVPDSVIESAESARRAEASEEVLNLTPTRDTSYKGPSHKIFVYPPGERGGIQVTAEERGRLLERLYLNDSLIDFYIKFLETKHMRKHKEMTERTTFFSSFFFGRLRQKQKKCIDYQGVKGWTKNINLFEKHRVFVPICDSFHWSIILILNLHNLENLMDDTVKSPGRYEEPKMVYLDSLHPPRGTEFGTVMHQYLAHEWLTKKKARNDIQEKEYKDTLSKIKNFIPVLKPSIPLQSNEYDCGLYLLQCIEMFLENVKSFRVNIMKDTDIANAFTHSEVEELRFKILSVMESLEDRWNVGKGETVANTPTKSPTSTPRTETTPASHPEPTTQPGINPSTQPPPITSTTPDTAPETAPDTPAACPADEAHPDSPDGDEPERVARAATLAAQVSAEAALARTPTRMKSRSRRANVLNISPAGLQSSNGDGVPLSAKYSSRLREFGLDSDDIGCDSDTPRLVDVSPESKKVNESSRLQDAVDDCVPKPSADLSGTQEEIVQQHDPVVVESTPDVQMAEEIDEEEEVIDGNDEAMHDANIELVPHPNSGHLVPSTLKRTVNGRTHADLSDGGQPRFMESPASPQKDKDVAWEQEYRETNKTSDMFQTASPAHDAAVGNEDSDMEMDSGNGNAYLHQRQDVNVQGAVNDNRGISKNVEQDLNMEDVEEVHAQTIGRPSEKERGVGRSFGGARTRKRRARKSEKGGIPLEEAQLIVLDEESGED